MIIGNFKKQAKGYAGDLTTLTHQAKLVFTPASKGVDYEVTLDGIKLGAVVEEDGAGERQGVPVGAAGQPVSALTGQLRADAAGRRQPHPGVEPRRSQTGLITRGPPSGGPFPLIPVRENSAMKTYLSTYLRRRKIQRDDHNT